MRFAIPRRSTSAPVHGRLPPPLPPLAVRGTTTTSTRSASSCRAPVGTSATSGPEPFRRGTVILVPPGVGHGYRQPARRRVYNCFFRAELDELELIWVFRDTAPSQAVQSRPASRARGCARSRSVSSRARAKPDAARLLSILNSSRWPTAGADPGARAGPLARRRWTCSRPRGRTRRLDAGRAAGHASRRPGLELLERDLTIPWTLAELCARLYVGPFHLARLFGRSVGMPPMHYLARGAPERAAGLLAATDQPVAAVGAAVGWPDPSQFSRRFRAEFGASPRAYRQRVRGRHGGHGRTLRRGCPRLLSRAQFRASPRQSGD